MKTFSLSSQGLGQHRTRLILQASFGTDIVIAMVVLFAVAFGVSSFFWVVVVPTAVISVGVLGFSAYQSFKRQRVLWESLRVELGDDYVALRYADTPEKRLWRNQVTALQETNEGLALSTAHSPRALVIPVQLDSSDYQEIKTQLSTWASA